MPHLPATPAARSVRRMVATLSGLAALTACAGRGPLTLAADSRAATPATVLTCVAEVAAESGLPVIEHRAEAETPELRAQSAAVLTTGIDARAASAVDVLVVSVGRVGKGLRARAQTFQPRAATSEQASNGTLWQSATPSPRVARARDAVLDRCSTLGD